MRLQSAPANAGDTIAHGGSGRRLGELLIEENLIISEQLEDALRVQETLQEYVPIGQLLVTRRCLTRSQLTAALRRYRKRARLGEFLLKAGRITAEQLEIALASQKQTREPLGRTLIALGCITEHQMLEALCAQLHINFFDLDRIPLDPSLATVVRGKYAMRRRLVPLFRTERLLVVALGDPTDVAVVEELQHLLRLRVEIVASTEDKIERALGRLYAETAEANFDVGVQHNVIIGPVYDREVAELAVSALNVLILPPHWQQPGSAGARRSSVTGQTSTVTTR